LAATIGRDRKLRASQKIKREYKQKIIENKQFVEKFREKFQNVAELESCKNYRVLLETFSLRCEMSPGSGSENWENL